MQFALFFSEAIMFCFLSLKNVILSWLLRLLYEIFRRLILIGKAVRSLKELSVSYKLGDFTMLVLLGNL